MITSGIRLGTPAMTTRGFKAEEAVITANLIADMLDNPQDQVTLARVRADVAALVRRHPVYGN
jgi:glycine hydroxymethyltransferase